MKYCSFFLDIQTIKSMNNICLKNYIYVLVWDTKKLRFK
jgi:hypothetical protein